MLLSSNVRRRVGDGKLWSGRIVARRVRAAGEPDLKLAALDMTSALHCPVARAWRLVPVTWVRGKPENVVARLPAR